MTAPVQPDNVVSLGKAPVAEPSPVAPTKPQGPLHRAAIAGMTICAIVGILSMLAFITVSWPEESSRYVVAVLIGSGVGFLASASIAVFSAARETYAPPRTSGDSDDQPE
ncbi:MAG TPA: hypothetical protein VEV82_00225 [Actinomycetota bacterium]|nr:hypothetical protein [Actinomycetota bacterium]